MFRRLLLPSSSGCVFEAVGSRYLLNVGATKHEDDRQACYFISEYVVIIILIMTFMDRDSSVGIEIRYGLDGPGIESR